MGRRLAGAAAAGLAALVAAGGAAYVPPADRIANAIAKENRSAGRAALLALEVVLELGPGGEEAARGSLLADPSGRARVELRSPRGTVERHLQQAGRLLAARMGEPIERPRPFLPPVFLLQALDGASFVRFVADLGIEPATVALGYHEQHDCFVFGGRGPASASPGSVWVDQESFAVVRIDLPDGRRFDLGPERSYGKLRLPAWIDLRQDDRPSGRLRIEGASRPRASSGAFDPAWVGATP